VPVLQPTVYRHIVLTANAINDEIRRSTWFETGGAPPGYASADNALVITHASGPGPRAIKRPWSITVDGAYTTQFRNHIYKESAARLDYVGDWPPPPRMVHQPQHRRPGLS
jgi:hypothetical protein